MAGPVDYTLRYKLEADSKQLNAELNKVNKQLAEMGSSKTSLGDLFGGANAQFGSFNSFLDTASSKLGQIPIPAAAAATAVAGIGTAALGAGVELFNLAKQGSDLGRSFGSFEAKTGLSATAVSTLAVAAKQSNKELSDLQRPLVFLSENLVKARLGNDDLKKAFHDLGVTDLKTLDGALDQLSKTFNSSEASMSKLHAAVLLMGKRGGPDMVSILSKLQGGFRQAQEDAAKLGLTLSEADVKASKDFRRELDTLSQQVEIGAAKFALAYTPKITEGLHYISRIVADNKDEWARWGRGIVTAGTTAIHGIEYAGSFITFELNAISGGLYGQHTAWQTWANVAKTAISLVASPLIALGSIIREVDHLLGNDVPSGGSVSSGAGGANHSFGRLTAPFGGTGVAAAHSSRIDPAEEWLKRLEAMSEADSKGGGGAGKTPKVKSDLPAFGSMSKLVLSTGNPQWDAWFAEMGAKWHVDPNVLLLQANKESSGHAGAVSQKGAQGFSQFMPGTAARFRVDTSSVKDSIRGQAQYMAFLLSIFGGDYSKALAGYNAGEGNVQKYGGIPPFKETRDYVSKIKSAYTTRVRSTKDGNYGTYDPDAAIAEENKKAEEAINKRIEGFNRVAEIGKITYDELLKEDERYYARAEESGDIQAQLKAANDIYSVKVARANDELDLATKIATQYKQGTEEREKADFEWAKALIKNLGDVKAAYYDLENVRRKITSEMAEESLRMVEANGSPNVAEDPSKNLGKGLTKTGIASVDVILKRAAAVKEESEAVKELKASWKALKEEMKAAADVKGSLVSMGQIGINVLLDMKDALQSSIESYLLYGDSVSAALKKALAAELAHVAALAGVKAIEATAWGFLRLAQWDFAGAAHAFLSATLWAGLAVGTGLGARALSGKGKSTTSSAGTSSTTQAYNGPTSLGSNQSLGNFTRQSNAPWMSGNDMQNRALASTLDRMNQHLDRLESASPGDVFLRGMKRSPGAVGDQLLKDWRSNSSQSSAAAKTMGLK